MEPAIDIAGATVARGRVVLLDRVSWRAGGDEHWVVLGPNGAGKTTLLRLAATMVHPTTGFVAVLGHRLGSVDVRALRGAQTALDIVLTGAFGSIALQRRRLSGEHTGRAGELLAQVGARALADRRFDDCSQGERQRILIARALMAEPDLLLLDEPAAGLDLPSRERLVGALAGLARRPDGPPTVTVTHHLEEIPPSCTHALLLAGGRVLAAGPVDEALTSEAVSACFGVDVEVARRRGRWTAAVRLA